MLEQHGEVRDPPALEHESMSPTWQTKGLGNMPGGLGLGVVTGTEKLQGSRVSICRSLSVQSAKLSSLRGQERA